MQILVVSEGTGALGELPDVLRHSGHDVRVVPDHTAARSALAEQKADIAVVATTVACESVVEVGHALKVPEDPTYRALIAVALDDTAAAREAAYHAGADDVAVAGASATELADHVHSAERIVELERRLRERVLELESALRRLAMHAMLRGKDVAQTPSKGASRGKLNFLLTSAWTGLDALLCRMCTEYLQGPFVHLIGAAAPAGHVLGARIGLTDVENALKLELSFYATEESARAIATGFCGGDESMVDEDVIRDVLLELANSGMGAVKAAFLGEQFTFTAAVPETIAKPDPTKQLEAAEAKRVLAFRSDTAVVYAVVTLRHQGRVRVLASRLKEGMVVASDVLNEAGALLVKAGTRLTQTSAEKLGRLIPRREVELADAA